MPSSLPHCTQRNTSPHTGSSQCRKQIGVTVASVAGTRGPAPHERAPPRIALRGGRAFVYQMWQL
eukprot:6113238-Lingulodinium_polyedra.AAC.1